MLDLKYRPLKFADVIGNVGPVTVLKRRSNDGTLLQRSILLGGPKGCGKTTLARIISRACICKNKDEGEPCNECYDCRSIMDGSSSSVFEFDAAAHGTVDNIRNIVDNLDYVNFDGNPTILTLDEAHRLSPASQDAMLKSMEDRSLFAILCTTEPNKIRSAVRDRVDEYSIRQPDKDSLVSHLSTICDKEGILYEDKAISIIVDFNDNSPRSSINAITSLSYIGGLSEKSVGEYYKFSSIDVLKRGLSYLAENPSFAIGEIYEVLDKEPASWVKDTILKLINNSIRHAHSIKTNFSYFFIQKSDIVKYVGISNVLSNILKPTNVDIELALLSVLSKTRESAPVEHRSHSNSVHKSSFDQSVPHTESIKPEAELRSVLVRSDLTRYAEFSSTKSRILEVDGVKFTSEESLTSVDMKMGPGRKPDIMKEETILSDIDNSKVPISDQEFSRVFTEKFSRRFINN